VKKENQDTSLAKIILVANMYYKNGFSQQQISQILQISRPWVSKLLSRAEELGVVEIRINSSIGENRELSDQLRNKYGLIYASAVSTKESDNPAMSAANYFMSQLKPDTVVGVGWGKSISQLIDNLPEMQFPDVRIIPLAGSFGTSVETMPNYSAIQVASKLGGTVVPLHAPAFCTSDEEYEAMRTNPFFLDVLNQAEQADVVLVGIGALDGAFRERTGMFTEEQVQELHSAGAVGDIVLNFIDSQGKKVETEITRRIISADITKAARQAKNIIVFADGIDKVSAIRAALRGGFATSLITSEETARELLK